MAISWSKSDKGIEGTALQSFVNDDDFMNLGLLFSIWCLKSEWNFCWFLLSYTWWRPFVAFQHILIFHLWRGAKKKRARIMMVTHKFDHKNLAFFQIIFVVLPSQLTVLKSLFHHEDIAFWIFSYWFGFIIPFYVWFFSTIFFQTLSLLLNTMVDVFGRSSQTSTAVEASEIADLIDFLRVQASWNFLLYALKFYVFKEFTLTKLLCVSAIMLSIMKGREVLSSLTASLNQRFLPFVGRQQKVYV